jgi:hypothetical protein
MLNNKAYDRKKVSLKKDLESCLFSHSKSFSIFWLTGTQKGKQKYMMYVAHF